MICSSCGSAIETFNRFCPKCGAPVQFQTPTPAGPSSYPPSYNPPPQQMYSGPGGAPPPRKSSCGKIILILGIILVLLLGAIGAAIYFGYGALEKKLKSSEAYTVAVQALKENPEVQDKMGEIQETGFPLGAYTQNDQGSGEAAFVMSVKGAKASGQYQVEMKRSSGVWRIVTGKVRLANGETIDVGEHPGAVDESEDANLNTNADDVIADQKAGVVDGGILNSKALTLPKPPYPPIARQVKASGTVVVQVLIDENGNVIQARAISGHPLLQAAATAAARNAKFAPRKVGGKAVKVRGLINYNFVAE
ncbi:MAG: TonB family protein [Pyrinomonadaceae bacterium]